MTVVVPVPYGTTTVNTTTLEEPDNTTSPDDTGTMIPDTTKSSEDRGCGGFTAIASVIALVALSSAVIVIKKKD